MKKLIYITIALTIVILLALFLVLFILKPWGSRESIAEEESWDPIVRDLVKEAKNTLVVESLAFKNGERIPSKYTCDGIDSSPPLTIKNIPSSARSLVIIVFDPDAPYKVFYHWLLYDIPVSDRIVSLPEGISKDSITEYGLQGYNDFNKIGYNGPCPPRGHGVHRYFFLALALDERIELEPKLSLRDLVNKIKGHVIAYGYTYGVYSR